MIINAVIGAGIGSAHELTRILRHARAAGPHAGDLRARARGVVQRYREAGVTDSPARIAIARGEGERAGEVSRRADRIRAALGLAASESGRALRASFGVTGS